MAVAWPEILNGGEGVMVGVWVFGGKAPISRSQGGLSSEL